MDEHGRRSGSLYDLLHNADQHLPFEVRMKMGLDAAKVRASASRISHDLED